MQRDCERVRAYLVELLASTREVLAVSWNAQTTVIPGEGQEYDLSALDVQRPTGDEPGRQFDLMKEVAGEVLARALDANAICKTGEPVLVTISGHSHEEGGETSPADAVYLSLVEQGENDG